MSGAAWNASLSELVDELVSGKKWVVRRTIWPYKDGWGTYCPSTRTVLDSGLTKEEAQARCDELNGVTA